METQKPDKFDFNYDTAEFDWKNALFAANLCSLVYLDEPELRKFFESDVAKDFIFDFEFIDSKKSYGGLLKDAKTDTQAFMIYNKGVAHIVFRGTEPSKWTDIKTDLDAYLVSLELGNTGVGEITCEIHHGFFTAFQEVESRIMDILSSWSCNDVVIYGHSLGGSIAKIAAANLECNYGSDIMGVYTFGEPPQGRRDWVKAYESTYAHKVSFRIRNNNDIVPALGIPGAKHCSPPYYFDRNGSMRMPGEINKLAKFWDKIAGAIDDIGDIGLDAIKDHFMAEYQRLVIQGYLQNELSKDGLFSTEVVKDWLAGESA